jgi:hypothetical protein
VNHLFFRRVELKNDSSAQELEFIRRRRFQRGRRLNARLNEERRASWLFGFPNSSSASRRVFGFEPAHY